MPNQRKQNQQIESLKMQLARAQAKNDDLQKMYWKLEGRTEGDAEIIRLLREKVELMERWQREVIESGRDRATLEKIADTLAKDLQASQEKSVAIRDLLAELVAVHGNYKENAQARSESVQAQLEKLLGSLEEARTVNQAHLKGTPGKVKSGALKGFGLSALGKMADFVLSYNANLTASLTASHMKPDSAPPESSSTPPAPTMVVSSAVPLVVPNPTYTESIITSAATLAGSYTMGIIDSPTASLATLDLASTPTGPFIPPNDPLAVATSLTSLSAPTSPLTSVLMVTAAAIVLSAGLWGGELFGEDEVDGEGIPSEEAGSGSFSGAGSSAETGAVGGSAGEEER